MSLPSQNESSSSESRSNRIASYCLAAACVAVFGGELDLLYRYYVLHTDRFEMIGATYNFNTLWLPPALLALGALAAFVLWRASSRSRWRRGGGWVCVAAGGALALTRVWATHIEPHRLGLRVESFTSPKLAAPLTILHISDIQSAGIGAYEEGAFARMRDLHPDLVIHTGDLIQPLPPATPESEAPKMARLMASLEAPLGKFTVMGDVDWCTYRQHKAGIGGLRLLEGEEAAVELPQGRRLRILGLPLEISHQSAGSPLRKLIADWLARTDPGDFTLLIGHAPDFALVAQEFPIDLCLAGHTHGGQICIPGYGPPMILSDVPRDWARGWREVGRTRLDVSAGIGAEHIFGLPSIRLFCPPEMVLIKGLPGN